jgi:hypothetical protein
MSEDPIMRYVAVLKERVSDLEKTLEKYEEIDAENTKIIDAYKKMTGIVVLIDNDDKYEDSIFS